MAPLRSTARQAHASLQAESLDPDIKRDLGIAGIDRDTSLSDVFRGALWFVVMEMFTIGLIFLFPVIVTWLPDTMMGR